MPHVFAEDRRAVWRVTWTLGGGFTLAAGVLRENDAGPWWLFAGIALLLLGIGASALLRSAQPLVTVREEGLCVHAGGVGLGGRGGASEFVLPWQSLTRVGFVTRQVDRGRDGSPMHVVTLTLGIDEAVARPDGHHGFLAPLADRRGARALGEHWIWHPEERALDLMARPRGGYAPLTAAIASAAPHLADPSLARREGLGGALSYAIYDGALVCAVALLLLVVAADRTDVLVHMGRQALAWGSRVPLS